VDFYSSMAAVRSAAPAADLSTGEPLLVDGLAEMLRDALAGAAREPA
jgi:hypothetical protein